MPVPQGMDMDFTTYMGFGQPLSRPTASIAAGGTIHLFQVTVGRVILRAIVGQVTTIIQAQATTAKLTGTPTVGTAVDFCATSDITGKEVGSKFSITGLASDGLVMALAGGVALMRNPVVIEVGYLDLILGAASTGSVKWDIRWSPFDPGAIIAAV